jgi:peptidoglycan/xylan/chitin deacetylase (PgdA/CDA1 family)
LKKQVLVLNYHQIDAGFKDSKPAIQKLFAVTRTSFENQVNLLLKHKIPVISIYDIINNKVADDFSVAITCDDGNASDFGIVYPLLKKHGMTATFFYLAGEPGSINREQAREMIRSGFHIGSHGLTHRDLSKLSPEEQQVELESSKNIIENEIGRPVDFFSFPYGIYSGKIMEQAKKEGYKAVLTTDSQLNFPAGRPFVIHRWSVKRTTSLRQFEKILTRRSVRNQLVFKAKIRKFAFRVLGRNLSDRLNLFLYSSGKIQAK